MTRPTRIRIVGGQVVFREADRGDWLYVVTDGEIEVVTSFAWLIEIRR